MRARVAGPRLTVYRPATAAPFDPTSITGLQAWYDASDAASITASGGAVSQWNDKSGNARHVTQSTGSAQPTTGTRTQNSLNVLDFDGGDTLLSAGFTVVQPLTVFGVVLTDVTTFAASNRQWFGNTSANPTAYMGNSGGAKWTMYAGSTEVFGSAADTNAHAWSWEFTGGSSVGYIDGVSNLTGNPGALGTTAVSLGCDGPSASHAQFWDGWIAEVLLYDSVLSTANRQAVEAYLKAKWGTP